MTGTVDAATAEREHVVFDGGDLEALGLELGIDVDIVRHGEHALIAQADQIAAELHAVGVGHGDAPDALPCEVIQGIGRQCILAGKILPEKRWNRRSHGPGH